MKATPLYETMLIGLVGRGSLYETSFQLRNSIFWCLHGLVKATPLYETIENSLVGRGPSPETTMGKRYREVYKNSEVN